MLDAVLHDRSGEPVGRVVEIMVDPSTREPRWIRVLGDGDGVLVPAVAVSETAPGVLIAAYDTATISSARHAEGAVTSADAARLAELYGLPGDGRRP